MKDAAISKQKPHGEKADWRHSSTLPSVWRHL